MPPGLDGHNCIRSRYNYRVDSRSGRAPIWRLKLNRLSLLVLFTSLIVLSMLATSCHHQLLSSNKPPVTLSVTSSFLDLIPELGWDDAGMIKRDVLLAKSITCNGITFNSTGVAVARPSQRGYFGKYEYLASFKSDAYVLWIYAYTDDAAAVLLNVRTAHFEALRSNKNSTELKLYNNLIIGKARLEAAAELPVLGKTTAWTERPEGMSGLWRYEGNIKRFHSIALQFNNEGVLEKVSWWNG
jgi:hypothetical protein